jgi:hypothetical protein
LIASAASPLLWQSSRWHITGFQPTQGSSQGQISNY